MSLGFVDNKSTPNRITFYSKTLFEIPNSYKPSDPIPLYEAIELICKSIEYGTDYLIGKNQFGEDIFKLSIINDSVNRETWEDWKVAIDSYRSVMILFDHANYFDIGKRTVQLRTAFHQL
jgi:hypothetical protein